MSLSGIKGQALAVKLLKRAAASGRLAHTYLFYGPQGTGKEFTARQFAKVLNCSEKKGDSCDICSVCSRIEQNKHPDILWIYPGGKSRVIKIEQVRKLQDFIAWRPYEGKVKVCVIADAHTLKVEAANALLKTLEEPPVNSVLILITPSPEILLPTIKSRAQGVQFFNLEESTVMEILEEKLGLQSKEAEEYSRLSMGSVSRALSFKDERMFGQRKLLLDMLAEGSLSTMKNLIDKIEEIQDMLEEFKDELIKRLKNDESEEDASLGNKKDMDSDAFVSGEYRKRTEEILSLILTWYRDILVYKTTYKSDSGAKKRQKEEVIFNKDYIDRIKFWSDKYSDDELFNKIEIVDSAREAFARQVNLKLLLQVMFAQLGLV